MANLLSLHLFGSLFLALPMEVIVDDLRLRLPDNLRQLLLPRLANALYRLECRQQVVAGLDSNALDIIQFRVEGTLGTLLAVEGDGKAVNLVLQLGQHMEKFGVGL